MTRTIGILAYGSLIDDPGCEIQEAIVRKKCCRTPFKVEYARKSTNRSNAPTLVPFNRGAKVSGRILVVDLTLREATDRLYRREINKVGCKLRTYSEPGDDKANAVRIKTKCDFEGIDLVIYASLRPNIEDINPENLACLAICSARKRRDGRDGISYLINAKNAGIRTPRSDAYETEILKMTKAQNLKDALNACRPS